jgi:hypothetical protein
VGGIVYMISYILIGLSILLGVYFYMQTSQKSVEEPMENYQQEAFIPSESFIGTKEGYVFKNDSNGLGYYLDTFYP